MLMMTHVFGDKLVELTCVLRDDSDEQDRALVCGVEDLLELLTTGTYVTYPYCKYHRYRVQVPQRVMS